MAIATVNGVETYHEVAGKGTPVLFIHGGFGGPGSTLAPQPQTVADTLPGDSVKTIVYDRRCAGKSQYVLSEYGLPDIAADARALLEHLGISRSVIVGSSMGGMVAMEYALNYPETVQALALINTGANLMGQTDFGSRLGHVVGQAREVGDRAFFESHKKLFRNPPDMQIFGPNTPEVRELASQRHQDYLTALTEVSDDDLCTLATGMTRNYAAFIGYDYTARLSELKMPVCIVHGNADVTVPFKLGKALLQGIPHAEFYEIQDGTHGILNYPDGAKALRDWVLRVID